MTYAGTNAFFTKGYLIDFRNKRVDVEKAKGSWKCGKDFLLDWLFKTFCHTLATLFVLVLLFSLEITDFFIFFRLPHIVLFWGVLFLIFNIYYVTNNTPLASKLQMIFEIIPFGFLSSKEIEFNFKKVKEIEMHMTWYWKYSLKFRGECIDFRDTIEYKSGEGYFDDYIKIIKFTKPVSGNIVFNHQAGSVNKIIMRE